MTFENLQVMENLSFQVEHNEIVAIIGPSGCGKTSLLNMVAGLQTPTTGTIEVSGEATSFIFQDDRLLPWRTVWDNIALVGQTDDKVAIQGLIDAVGLSGFEHYYPCQLSGGMQKRCGIARAFYYNSQLLLMDEPFQGLDYCLRREMLQMLLTVWETHRQSILFVTHEIDEALLVAHRILVLSKRPSTILETFTLPPHNQRTLADPTLLAVRQKVIEAIT
ncbi:ATP-binding cassette domain-containing protein [Bengtsoniella intestinalis]|uniref:ABC transporter ATP-binding protein n=1 Tax=Bengtsoniella intestinalis TaxID=3073143 RepID=UPI00391F0657